VLRKIATSRSMMRSLRGLLLRGTSTMLIKSYKLMSITLEGEEDPPQYDHGGEEGGR